MAAVAPPDELAEEIAERCDAEPDDILKAADEKEDKYDGLVHGESAVILAGKQEFGVDIVLELRDEIDLGLDVANIEPEMSSVSFEADVSEVGNTFTYGSGDDGGRGRRVILYDDTGTVTLMLWNEQVELFDGVERGYHVTVTNAYSDTYKGDLQVKLGDEAEVEIEEPSDEGSERSDQGSAPLHQR